MSGSGQRGSYMDLVAESVEACSGGALTLMPVPEELRVSPESLVALSYDMYDAVSANERARRDSFRKAAYKA